MQTQFTKANVITTNIENLRKYQDILSQICQEELQGIIIKQIFSKAEMQQLAKQVQLQETGFYPTRYGKTYGLSLSDIDGNKSHYFEQARQFREILNQALPTGFEATITNIFHQISGGRKITSPEENAEKYTPATVRFVPPNQPGIITHIDSEFTYSNNYSYLHQIANIPNCLSYFIVVDKPLNGGELTLYEFYFDSEKLRIMETGRNQFIVQTKQNLDNYPKKTFDLSEGDLVVFKSSIIPHEIAYVSGQKTRITIGGFLAISHDQKSIYYWS